MTDTQFDGLNFVKGACKVDGGKVVLNAVGTDTDKTCNFACKDGNSYSKEGTNIAFTCALNDDVTKAEGNSNWNTIGECRGA